MKKKILLLFGLLIFCISLAMAQQRLTIKGEVNGDLKGLTHVYLYGKGHAMDTTEIVNGRFQFIIPYVKGFIPMLCDEYCLKTYGGFRVFPILVDRPGTIEIKNIDIAKDLVSGTITGIKSAEDFQEYSNQEMKLSEEVTAGLVKKHGSMPAFPADGKVTPELAAFAKEQQELTNKKLSRVIEAFIKSHPDSYASVFVLSGSGINALEPPDLERLYHMLSKNLQGSEEGMSIPNYLLGLKNSKEGNVVNDFTLTTDKNTAQSFKQLNGKYVLIDFWASWCGPCKQSFPHMKDIYEKFKSDKFEIYSISIDKKKTDWLRELKTQQLPWLQAIDDKDIAHKYFGVTAVPTTFLIDPNGKIVMKEIGFSPDGLIEKKLVDLFGAM
ncbi:MAG: AhpC/TSA family protein [Bacteroidota bacterium]|nr:AhpC/TSA family protein [Bacteroidota bacterium]